MCDFCGVGSGFSGSWGASDCLFGWVWPIVCFCGIFCACGGCGSVGEMLNLGTVFWLMFVLGLVCAVMFKDRCLPFRIMICLLRGVVCGYCLCVGCCWVLV